MGVKSLWNLLAPVGRPILLETVEGKTMAIDSSIWIYQFQATMRDTDGRVLVNAHVLGFLRRITKLLFYGIKPVFVFDGGAPALKRNTLVERKQKKRGAATSSAKLAERLLSARLRKEALERAGGASNNGKKKGNEEDEIVYLEDVDPTIPKAPPRHKGTDSASTSPSKRKAKFYDHDPYKLPDVDLDATISKATKSAAPDPRLATEDELRSFIEEMRPEDFDINSPEFRELPTEIQYEIIGDLRLKSRQTSYARLEKMLRKSRTPMDFSIAQIRNLKQRNALTQQLLVTTDSIGKAHISIPVRIASERNREYVLIKNEGEDGGWILGIRDHGTQEKPIVIDQDGGYASSDEDMEEVPVDAVPIPVDEQFRKEMAPHSMSSYKSSRPSAPMATSQRPTSKPLFDLDDDDSVPALDHIAESESDDDEALPFAVQASFDDAGSRTTNEVQTASTQAPPWVETYATQDAISDDSMSPLRPRTILYVANIGPLSSNTTDESSTSFGAPSLLSTATSSANDLSTGTDDIDHELDDVYIDAITPPPVERVVNASTNNPELNPPRTSENCTYVALSYGDSQQFDVVNFDSDEEMEEVLPEPDTLSQFARDNPEPKILGPASWVTEQAEVASQDLSTDKTPLLRDSADGSGEEHIAWSRSPSPAPAANSEVGASHVDESWDAAQEMDLHAEEGEFARFVSQVKGRDLGEIQREINDEIDSLNQQRKAAMRDSEDITQHMISQIMTMLRLFGIPYVTAPMEAEAQCAELVSLGLVDGVITDDSDVFLFGAQRVFKNMFNQSKTVECFLLSDLSRELGLDRDTLVRLAYLLGSDYVEGLPGIGPVVAMELLKEFPGIDGLHKFKDWWLKVQRGADTLEDSKSKFRKRFKKKFKALYLDKDWPDSAVRDAYYHPTVDSSEEPFKWGMPDLDGLRQFFQQELGWQQTKVDELLLPIIQKMNKRGQVNATNRQSSLSGFFDFSAGMGAYVPRKRQAYASKRLQDVVADFRRQRASGLSIHAPEGSSHLLETDLESGGQDGNAKKKRRTGQGSENKTSTTASKRKTKNRKGKRKVSDADTEGDEGVESDAPEGLTTPPPLTVQLRPRPRHGRK